MIIGQIGVANCSLPFYVSHNTWRKMKYSAGICFWILWLYSFGESSNDYYSLSKDEPFGETARHKPVDWYLKTYILTISPGPRMKRHLPPPFLMNEYMSCMSQPGCEELHDVTSVASGSSHAVFYVTTRGNILKVQPGEGDNLNCSCTLMQSRTEPAYSVVMDDRNLYWLDETHSTVMYMGLRSNGGVLSKKLSPEMLSDDKKFHRAACLVPPYVSETPPPFSVFADYAMFDLSVINTKLYAWFNSTVCIQEVKPNITLAFLYKKASVSSEDASVNTCLQSPSCLIKVVSASSYLKQVKLGHLVPNALYIVHVVIFTEANKHESTIISSSVNFSTACTVPSPPSNLACHGVNQTALRLTWDEPTAKNSDQISYEVVYTTATSDITLNRVVTHQSGGSLDHADLEFVAHKYSVRAYPVNCPAIADQFKEANVTGCKPLQGPVKLSVARTSKMEIEVVWKAPEDNGVRYIIIEWTKWDGQNSDTWASSDPIEITGSFTYTVTDLDPNTGYRFRTNQQYVGYTDKAGWLFSDAVVFSTQADVPSYPQNVRVEEQYSGDFLVWQAAKDNGAFLDFYSISARNRSSPNASRILYGKWEVLSNVSDRQTRWELKGLAVNVWYEFRVLAKNSVGVGDASAPSEPYMYTVTEEVQEVSTLWIVVGTTGSLVILIVILIFVIACRRCGNVPRPVGRSPSSSEITTIHLSYGMDLQLAQLRHLSELASVRGVPGMPKDYLELLPLFPRDKLELTDFLGKGAFGEVFKGIASDVGGDIGTKRRVAVKTLREGSTDAEKYEFLMEAYFMSNFKHKNILSLLGVCLDNEPQYLIMELMEGGDLLFYVREARPNPIMGPKLTTADLLDICLDVAAGCKYLEEQRFIHRDLAARNCLVNTKMHATEHRLVKIGDFGLARDIYKSDYYQKMGEGLLPVRWMAPESLVDNVYTTQSDTWSFGVLLWEIMSFGQQPYPTYTNIEVLQHVRAGGRLYRPENCPKDIYALMIKCWHTVPTLRPSFSWTLEWLQEFKDRNLTAVQSSGSEYDLSAVNYTTVTTSDEDFADEGMHTPNRSQSLTLGRHENAAFERSKRHVSGYGVTRVLVHATPRDDSDSVSADEMGIRAGRESSGNAEGNGYMHVSVDEHLARILAEAHLPIQEAGDVDFADVGDELNYSDLNFPPSRNQSKKSSFARRLLEGRHSCSQSTKGPPPAQALLPYMGDLPITDEERLLRKHQWSQQQNRIRSSDDVGEGIAVSPYLKGTLNFGFSAIENTVSEELAFAAHSERTIPKQIFQGSQCSDGSDHEISHSFVNCCHVGDNSSQNTCT